MHCNHLSIVKQLGAWVSRKDKGLFKGFVEQGFQTPQVSRI